MKVKIMDMVIMMRLVTLTLLLGNKRKVKKIAVKVKMMTWRLQVSYVNPQPFPS